MSIPEKALTAFYKAEIEYQSDNPEGLDRTPFALQAASPFIAAQALRDAAKKIDPKTSGRPYDPTARAMRCDAIALRKMADDLEGK